jgi:type VI protein secretion system component VasF
MEAEEERTARKRSIFDWIVLLGMVINLVIAVFMILYYFDLL